MHSKPKGKVRINILSNTIYLCSRSNSCYLLLCCILCGTFIRITNTYYMILIIPCLLLFYKLKPIIFEILLIEHSISNALGYFDWYSLVDDNLYLGGIDLSMILITFRIKLQYYLISIISIKYLYI